MKKNLFTRIGALAITAVMAFSMAVGVSAANEANATIDTSKPTSLTLFKYDLTSAEDAGVWDTESYVSTGIQDDSVNTTLSPYAVEGVEFSYVRLNQQPRREKKDDAHEGAPARTDRPRRQRSISPPRAGGRSRRLPPPPKGARIRKIPAVAAAAVPEGTEAAPPRPRNDPQTPAQTPLRDS